MSYYGGLDVSLKETHVCVRVPGGRIAASGCVETCPIAIAAWLGAHAPGAAAAVLETGGLSSWLCAGFWGHNTYLYQIAAPM